MLIDDGIYQFLKSIYGYQVASSLIIFFEDWRRLGEYVAMTSFPQRTAYTYRNLLLEAGLLKRTTDNRLIVPDEYKVR